MAGTNFNKGEINTDGYNYQLYTLLYCINCLRNNQNVREYVVSNADVNYGALDDVVLNVTFQNGATTTTAIQVKHSSTSKMIDERYLCSDSRTCLYKYFESFMAIKGTPSLEQPDQLILWTNMRIAEKIRDWFEIFVPDSDNTDILGEQSADGLSFQRYRIKSDHWRKIMHKYQEPFRKDKEASASQTKKRRFNDETSAEDWEQFFKRFVFYVNVPNVVGLKGYLVSNIENFDDLCKLVESCALKQIMTSNRIKNLFTLVNLRDAMETGPYTKLIFNDLKELQCKVKELFDNGKCNVLRVVAIQDVDCTVARLIMAVKKCLGAESKRYMAFSYSTFNDNWNELQPILADPKIIDIGLKCFIISSITEDEIQRIGHLFSDLKVIFVGAELGTNKFDYKCNSNKVDDQLDCLSLDDVPNIISFVDQFDINSLDCPSKNMIKNRKIRLSQKQSVTTANEIFGDELFRKENFSLVLELYRQHKDVLLQITVNEPSNDEYYRSRESKLRVNENTTVSIDLLNQTDFCKLVIHDLPGMGKTTELIKLASDFRKKYPDHLVVYLHCTAAVSKWKGSVEELICNSITTCSKLTNSIVKKVIQLGKLILLMDGYDEVSWQYKMKLEILVMEISRVRVFKLYIATRPQCTDEIKNILKDCGLCYLEPFSEDDQLAYLKKYWNIDDDDQSMIDENARCIIVKFRSLMNKSMYKSESDFEGYFKIPMRSYYVSQFKSKRESRLCGDMDSGSKNEPKYSRYDSSLIGIPLQTHMIAVIFKTSVLSSDFKVSESLTLGLVYKEFVELKFMESVKRNYDLTSNAHEEDIKNLRKVFLHSHVLVAVKIHQDAMTDDRTETEQLIKSIQHYGLVLTSPAVAFIHYSYLEYFLALYYLTYSIDISRMEEYMLNLLSQEYRLVAKFMNYLLYHVDLTETPNLSLNQSDHTHEPPADYILPKSPRLHRDKMIEFSLVLCNWRNSKINKFFDIMIINGMYNMIEGIYDSLRVGIKSEIRLCLNHWCRDDHPEVILHLSKSENTEQFLTLLNIILTKIPEKIFVTSFLTSLKELWNLMCDAHFFNLFEWFAGVVRQLKEEHRAVFEGFVYRKWGECLRKLEYLYSKLKNILNFVKTVWTVEEIEQFLIHNNVLSCFPQYFNRKLSKGQRVQIVDIVFDLYRWTFGEHIPLGSGFFDMLETISDRAVKYAFKTNLLSILESSLNENSAKFLTSYLISLDYTEKSLLKVMSDPDYCDILNWFLEVVPQLNEDQQTAFKRAVEKRWDKCLLQIIKLQNVDLLKKVIDWVKTECTIEAIRRFLTEKNCLWFLAEHIKYGVSGHCIKPAIIKIVNTVFDLYRWTFGEHIPMGSGFFDMLESMRHRVVKDVFKTNLISILDSSWKENSDKFVTSYLTSRDGTEKSLLEVMCDPDFSYLLNWFLEVVPQLNEEHQTAVKRTIVKRWDKCFLLIIKDQNVDLLKKVIEWVKTECTIETTRRFLTEKNCLCFLAENIEYHVYGDHIKSERIKMVHLFFDLYNWAFGEELLLHCDFLYAIRTVKSTFIRIAFGINFIPTLQFFLNINPNTFIESYITSLDDQEMSFLEVMCIFGCSKLFDCFVQIIPQLSEEIFATLQEIIAKRLNRCIVEIIKYNNVELLKKVIEWLKSSLWTVEAAKKFFTSNESLLLFFVRNILKKNILDGVFTIMNNDGNCITIDRKSAESRRVEMVHKVFDLYCWAFDGQVPIDGETFDAIHDTDSEMICSALKFRILPILESLLKENPNKIFTIYLKPLDDQKKSLLQLICYPDFSKLFDCFTEIFPQLNEEELEAFRIVFEGRLNICLWQIIMYENVQLLKKIVNWVKKTWKGERTLTFLMNCNFLPLLAKNVKIKYFWMSPQRIEIVHTVLDLYCWAFGEEKQLGSGFFYAINHFERHSSLKTSFETKFFSILKSSPEINPNILVTLYFTPVDDKEMPLLKVICDPDYSNIFKWFTNVVSQLNETQIATLTGEVERQWDKYLLKIISCNNCELVKKVINWVKNSWTVEKINRFLTNNNVLSFFAENIERGVNDYDESIRIEMTHSVFELYRWTFGDELPLDIISFDAIQAIRDNKLRKEFKSNLLSIIKTSLKNNPNTFVSLYLTSLDDQETSLLEVMCDPYYLQLFDCFTQAAPYLNEEQWVIIKKVIDEKWDKYLVEIIEYNNASLLKKIINLIQNTVTVETVNQFLKINDVLLFLAENVLSRRVLFYVRESERIEMVYNVFSLYRWAFDEQIPLTRDIFIALNTIKIPTIRSAFATNLYSIVEILLRKNLSIIATLFLTFLDDQEMSFCELMCDPICLKLFKCFLKVGLHLTEDQRAIVAEHVEKHWKRYLLEIIKNNNADLLSDVTNWIKNTLALEKIRRFLETKNILRFLAKHIEFITLKSVGNEKSPIPTENVEDNSHKSDESMSESDESSSEWDYDEPDTEAFTEVMRVDMVHSVFDLYCWAFDGKIELENDFPNVIETITNKPIRIAFQRTFLSVENDELSP